jgi:microcystin-dependent protein
MPTSLNNEQPTLALTQSIVRFGIFPFRGDPVGDSGGVTMAMIRSYGFDFAPGGTSAAQGQVMPISQNTALFALLGTTYGGNGQTTFALPNLDGRLVNMLGQGPGLTNTVLGEVDGVSSITLLQSQMPANLGGASLPVDNEQPTVTMGYYINATGIYPNGSTSAYHIGAVNLFAGNFAPGYAIPCDGRLLAIAEFETLFNLIGTTYGGDGQATFAVPDLRGRVPVGAGQGPGLTSHFLGETGGSETAILLNSNAPAVYSGAGVAVNNMQPYVALNYYVALQGIFPNREGGSVDSEEPILGEIFLSAADITAAGLNGFAPADGRLLLIAQNQALFALFGTTYGGNGQTTFALPDLRGRAIVGTGSSALIGEVTGTESYTLQLSSIPDLNYSGTAAGERLFAGDGNDTINGLGGNDTIYGMGGIDTLSGNDGDDIIISGDGNDTLNGGNNNDTLIGGSGNDRLDGGTGVNVMQGGSGDDLYIVSNATDSIFELVNDGFDRVEVNAASFTLGANIENMTYTGAGTFTGTGNALDNVIIGGTGVDNLMGMGGNDTLRGGTGAANFLFGGAGDDLYIVEAVGDSVIEVAGEGTDFVNTALASFTLSTNVENLTYTGASAFIGVGNASNNIIISGMGADTLNGMDGDDIIYGGSGFDIMNGGVGADQFRYNGGETSVDRILGFVSGTDKIGLLTTGFVHTAVVDLVQGLAPVAATANSTFLYNSGTGMLSYDADGNGAGAAVDLARLGGGLALSTGDFIFY